MKIIIVGLGGTGSYLLNHIIQYLKIMKKIPRELILIDGDVLEERNLLRQGFLKKDIGRNKAQVLKERFRKVVSSNVEIRSVGRYITEIKDLEDVVGDKGDIVIFSCVDNNMARYRIMMAQFKIHSDSEGGRRVIFVDAGNEEWHGQVLVNGLMKGKGVPVRYGEEGFKYTGETDGHYLNTIFDSREDWKSTLTRGDHEISCDVITEVAPQNIVTNMTSAAGMLYMFNKVLKKGYTNTRYQFNVKQGTQEELKVDSNYGRIKELVKYANQEGKGELFKGEEEQDVTDVGDIEQEIREENIRAGEDEEVSIVEIEEVSIDDIGEVTTYEITMYLESVGLKTDWLIL